MLIKVCGLTNNASSLAVTEIAEVTHIGFIFYEGSKRFTTQSFATDKKKVGVFVNEPLAQVEKLIELHQLDAVQLHGNETPDYAAQLSPKVEIIKAFGIAEALDLNKTDAFEGVVSTFLFDTKSKNHGGTGTSFDWEILSHYSGKTPFILSGGLGLHNVKELQQFQHGQLIGYDLNSCFEATVSVKNPELIRSFIKQLA